MARKASKLKGKKILLGVTGGIAAYKAVGLASKLTGAGAVVTVVMTENACELIGPKSFEAITAGQVFTTMWSESEVYDIPHTSIADEVALVVVAPATANIIAKMANGICDDLLSTTLCACWSKPVLLAPAMNDKMWANPAVQWNIKSLSEMGAELIGPEKGHLACGYDGMGRMSEPEDILTAVERIAAKIKKTQK